MNNSGSGEWLRDVYRSEQACKVEKSTIGADSERDDQNSEIARERMRVKISEDFWNIEEKGILVSAFKK